MMNQDPMMMDQGPGPMDMMGNNGDPMMMGPGGPGDMGMNGMPPDGMMMDGDPMMMGGPDMGQMMQPEPGFFESSEYPHPNKVMRGKATGHEVSRQSSTASMDLDSVSVKKIEDREDEYGRVKQALLSDFEIEDMSPRSEPRPFSPPSPAIHIISPADPAPFTSRPSDSLYPSSSRPRSRDTLESIFGSGSTAEPKVDDESRSSSGLSSLQLQAASKHDFPKSSSISKNNNLLMVEEPFPVCLSPELDRLTVTHQPPLVDVYTIPEVPEEEEGSPVTGDGVSRARRVSPGKPQPLWLLYISPCSLLCAVPQQHVTRIRGVRNP